MPLHQWFVNCKLDFICTSIPRCIVERSVLSGVQKTHDARCVVARSLVVDSISSAFHVIAPVVSLRSVYDVVCGVTCPSSRLIEVMPSAVTGSVPGVLFPVFLSVNVFSFCFVK